MENETLKIKDKLDLESVITILSNKRSYLHKTYKIQIEGIFGSYARNEQTITSDIDILISYGEDTTLFNKFALMEFLETLFLTKVDLVAEKYIKPTYKDSIMRDLIRI